MKTRLMAIATFALICNVAYAEAYKCTVDGEMIYSQLPCSDDAASTQQINITAGTNEKALYIAETTKMAEFAMLGLRAAMRDSQGCAGERAQKCQRFIALVDAHKLSRIYADMMSERLSKEDIHNIYRFCKDGPVQKEADMALVELKRRVFSGDPVRPVPPLSSSEIAVRDAFYSSSSGLRYKEFLIESKDLYTKAYQPYLSELAKQAGLSR